MAWKTPIVAAAVGVAVFVGVIVGVAIAVIGTSDTEAANDSATTQVARIYELQAAFHSAVTVHNPNDVDQRIADMLALWTDDGSLTLGPNTFSGKGEPGTPSCEEGAGTLCDFFTHVAPPFQNEWISLAPTFGVEIDVQDNTATLAFACHLFDTSWNAKVILAGQATVTKVGSDWLFAELLVTPVDPASPNSIPYP